MIGNQVLEPPESAAAAREDLTLAQRAVRDADAFATLYQRHVKQVYRYLLVRVGNADDAQDLTSQTFLEAMQHLPKFRGERPFIAWLLGIARHKVADHFRRRKPESDLETVVAVSEGSDPLEEVIGRQLEVETVSRKLKVLAPDRAEAVALRLFGGLDVAEIATLMEKNESAVRMLVFRGIRDLQAQLEASREERS